jgi:hypothetical protein
VTLSPLSLLLPPLMPSIDHAKSPSTSVYNDNSECPKDFLDPARAHTSTLLPPDDESDTSCSSIESFFIPASKMSASGPAECLHVEPKCIPLLTPGMVLPMVMRQWEMACINFFRVNKKIDVDRHVAVVLPGLKDMRA